MDGHGDDGKDALNGETVVCNIGTDDMDNNRSVMEHVGGGALSGHRRPSSVRPSVCLSDVAYIGSNSKTKRPRKTKLCTGVPQVTCDSHTDFKVKSQGQQGRGHILAAN